MKKHYPPGPRMNTLETINEFVLNEIDLMSQTYEWVREYGDIIYMKLFGQNFYIIANPEHLRAIMVENADKFQKSRDYRTILSRFLGNGLLTSDGEFWKRQRKLAQPAFHTQRIAAYGDIMTRETEKMLARWEGQATVPVAREMMSLTLNVVTQSLFHADVSEDTQKVWDAFSQINEIANRQTQAVVRVPAWVPTESNRTMKHATDTLHGIIMRIIAERRKNLEDTGDLLSMFMLAEDEDGQHMTDEQLRDEVTTMFLAGHETTANALSWAWVLLAQHPDITAKLRAELSTVLAGRTPTLADLRNLRYTEMIIKEVMRLYPPIPGVGREPIEDIEIGGYFIEKGSDIALMFYPVHHDERWFPNPETFDPERFSPEREKDIPRYAYLPFGGGPRVCIGNAFAMMEAVLVLAAIAQRVTLSLEPGTHVEMEPLLTLRPKGDLNMRVESVRSTELSTAF